MVHVTERSHGESAVDVVVVVQRQADLLQMVRTRGPAGGLSRLLNGRQKQGKPHGYYLHKLEVDFFSRFRPSPLILHTGVFALGRTRGR